MLELIFHLIEFALVGGLMVSLAALLARTHQVNVLLRDNKHLRNENASLENQLHDSRQALAEQRMDWEHEVARLRAALPDDSSQTIDVGDATRILGRIRLAEEHAQSSAQQLAEAAQELKDALPGYSLE